jgi:amidase
MGRARRGGLAGRVRRGDVTAAELAAQAAAGVAKVNPLLSAVVELFDDAVEDPFKAGARADGFFAGVPFLMKDLGPTMKGRLQEMGSLFMRGNRPTEDSFLTGRMRHAGLNLMGRTTTPEFGVCSSAENPAVYITRNPWDRDYTTLGSSAGTAAVLAAGVLPLAHATDGGGSIRIPAGANGNIGLKPSRGVFSIAPNLSDLTGLVSTQGCQSRTVRDTAAFVDHCRGGAPGEFMPYWTPDEPCLQLIERDPAPLRIALSHEWGDYRATAQHVAELERVGRFLEGLGHHVAWAQPAIDYRAAFAAQTTCYISNFAQTIANLLAPQGCSAPAGRADRADQHPHLGEGPAHQLQRARADAGGVQHHRTRLRGLLRVLGHHPDADHRAAHAAHRHHRAYLTTSDNPSVLDWFDHLWRNFAYTPLTNLCGIPGISLPLGTQASGLPLGIQAAGPAGRRRAAAAAGGADRTRARRALERRPGAGHARHTGLKRRP